MELTAHESWALGSWAMEARTHEYLALDSGAQESWALESGAQESGALESRTQESWRPTPAARVRSRRRQLQTSPAGQRQSDLAEAASLECAFVARLHPAAPAEDLQEREGETLLVLPTCSPSFCYPVPSIPVRPVLLIYYLLMLPPALPWFPGSLRVIFPLHPSISPPRYLLGIPLFMPSPFQDHFFPCPPSLAPPSVHLSLCPSLTFLLHSLSLFLFLLSLLWVLQLFLHVAITITASHYLSLSLFLSLSLSLSLSRYPTPSGTSPFPLSLSLSLIPPPLTPLFPAPPFSTCGGPGAKEGRGEKEKKRGEKERG